jgi:hypothetical protein
MNVIPMTQTCPGIYEALFTLARNLYAPPMEFNRMDIDNYHAELKENGRQDQIHHVARQLDSDCRGGHSHRYHGLILRADPMAAITVFFHGFPRFAPISPPSSPYVVVHLVFSFCGLVYQTGCFNILVMKDT